MNSCTALTRCVACGEELLAPFALLGEQPLANSVHIKPSEQAYYPLGLNFCLNCTHTQLTHSIAPELMFRDYSYVSGTTKTLRDYFTYFVDEVEKDYPNRKLNVLDIGCNDGSLLEEFVKRGHKVLGVDPSDIPVKIAQSKGIQVINDFWKDDVELEEAVCAIMRPDVIIAMNVLGHTPTPEDFLVACLLTMSIDGAIYVQTSQYDMVKQGQFDTVYHEHISYFNLQSMKRLAARCNLVVDNVKYVDIHGKSAVYKLIVDMEDTIREDKQARQTFLTEHILFNRTMETTLSQYERIVNYATKHAGYKHIAYGAAAKATVFYNLCEVIPEFVIDDNSLKHGGYLPGTTTPICPPSTLLMYSTQKLLIAIPAWNFAKEVISRVQKLTNNDKIVYLVWHPEVTAYDHLGNVLEEVV